MRVDHVPIMVAMVLGSGCRRGYIDGPYTLPCERELLKQFAGAQDAEIADALASLATLRGLPGTLRPADQMATSALSANLTVEFTPSGPAARWRSVAEELSLCPEGEYLELVGRLELVIAAEAALEPLVLVLDDAYVHMPRAAERGKQVYGIVSLDVPGSWLDLARDESGRRGGWTSIQAGVVSIWPEPVVALEVTRPAAAAAWLTWTRAPEGAQGL